MHLGLHSTRWFVIHGLHPTHIRKKTLVGWRITLSALLFPILTQQGTMPSFDNSKTAMTDKPTVLDGAEGADPTLVEKGVLTVLKWLQRSWWKIVLLLISILVAVDIYAFYRNFQGPSKINAVMVDFINHGLDRHKKASVRASVDGEIVKSSWWTSFDISAGQCSFQYRKSNDQDYKRGGDVLFDFSSPSDRSGDSNKFNVVMHTENVNFDILRRIYWDVTSKPTVPPIQSSVQVQCAGSMIVKLFHLFPVVYQFTDSTHHSDSLLSSTLKTKTFYLQDVQSKYQHNRPVNHDSGSSSKKKKGFDWHYKSMTRQHVNFQLDFTYNFYKQLIYNGYTIQSFVVHWPKVAYGLTFLDKDTELKSYLVIESEAATFDLAVNSNNDDRFSVSLGLNITCSAPSTGVHQAIEDLEQDCTLLTPLNLVEFKNEFASRKFINITAQSVHKTFISSFVGENHYLRSTDPSLYNPPFVGESRVSSVESRHDDRMLASTADSAISEGANCVTLDTDGVYMSQYCTQIEKGFVKLYADMYNDYGDVGYVNFATSWAPWEEHFAFASKFDGLLTYANIDYAAIGDIYFSQEIQNMTVNVALNYSDTQWFAEQFNAYWNADADLTAVSVGAKSTTILDGFEPISTVTSIDYGNGSYQVQGLLANDIYQDLGDAFTVYGKGSYSGEWRDW